MEPPQRTRGLSFSSLNFIFEFWPGVLFSLWLLGEILVVKGDEGAHQSYQLCIGTSLKVSVVPIWLFIICARLA